MTNEVVFTGAARSAIGDYGGALKGIAPAELAATVIGETVKRSGIEAKTVEACVLGNVIHTETRDMYVSRVASLNGGLPHSSQALTLNRLCGSGLQAIVSAAQQIELGHVQSAVAGGVENMSRGGFLSPDSRWGARMGNTTMMDMMVGALTDPFDSVHMGITAENVAEKWKISREEQDEAAVLSHQKAAKAQSEGRFVDQIVPIELKSRKGSTFFDTDEHVRGDVDTQSLGKLRAVFKSDGTVTAGNASGINDGAAAVVMMNADAAEKQGLSPIGRLVGYSLAGVDPKYMGIGPVPAVERLFKQTGLSMNKMDVVELNEAFAAQAIACARDLNVEAEQLNPNGSGISLGHPIGATGTVLTVKALHELQRIGGQYGLICMCIGGGQGIAAIIERV